ncbi:MAG: hypothetical protein ABIJ75_00100 [Actinomycetota bacterium]
MANSDTFYTNWGGAFTVRVFGFGMTVDWKPDPNRLPVFGERYRLHRTLVVEVGKFRVKVHHPWSY